MNRKEFKREVFDCKPANWLAVFSNASRGIGGSVCVSKWNHPFNCRLAKRNVACFCWAPNLNVLNRHNNNMCTEQVRGAHVKHSRNEVAMST